jgi:hypothetical protein
VRYSFDGVPAPAPLRRASQDRSPICRKLSQIVRELWHCVQAIHGPFRPFEHLALETIKRCLAQEASRVDLLFAHLHNGATHVIAALLANMVAKDRAAALWASLHLTRFLGVVCATLAGSCVGMSSLWYCHFENSTKTKLSTKFWEARGYRLPSCLSSGNHASHENPRRLPLAGIRKARKRFSWRIAGLCGTNRAVHPDRISID